MSLRVLVIPEDPTNDQHVLKPICEKLFEELGRRARIEILKDPHLRGVTEALDPAQVRAIVDENEMIDLFLLLVDRDGRGPSPRLGNTNQARAREQDHPGRLIACLAVEEVEVWLLALHRDTLEARWPEVRSHEDSKEAYFDPLMARRGWTGEVGGGRKRAMRELGARWRGLLEVCDELRELRDRLGAWLASHPEG